MQLCLMDEDSETNLYLDKADHGRTILDLPIKGDGAELIDLMQEACDRYPDFGELSAMKTGFSPVVLLACRHWRRPAPPQFYIQSLKPPSASQTDDKVSEDEDDASGADK